MIALVAGAAAGAAIVSGGLTAWVRRIAVSRRWLDVPNDRSLHSRPTPRGGGIAFVAPTLAGIVLGAAFGTVPVATAVGLVGGGAIVAVVGWLDDRRPMPPLPRVLVQAAAVAWALVWMGGLPTLTLGVTSISLGVWGIPVAMLVAVWAINLYNFMDGIDGMAAGEAASVGLLGGGLAVAAGDLTLAFVAFVVAGASVGFLRWNWSPARIFMGDVGSGFLGFMFGALAILGERRGTVPLVLWLVLGGVFVVDATATLMRRIATGERWYAPHRSHAYQRAVVAGRTHGSVVASVLVINSMLAALAAIAMWQPAWLGAVLAAALALLTACYWLASREPRHGVPAAGRRLSHERER